MSIRRLTSGESQAYWRRTHLNTSSDLEAVCFPGKSQLLNAFFDRIQTYAMRRALDELKLGGSDARVLEVGCGRGRWLRFFRDRGTSPTGLDLSHEAVARCAEQGLSAVVGSAEELPFPSGSFDLVVSVTVLLHLPPGSQRRAAAEMQRVCRTGGNVVVLEGTGRDPSPHVWSRATKDWIALFDNCRLVFKESHYFAFPLRLLWKTPIGLGPRWMQMALENAAVGLAWPLELALMRIRHGRTTRGALQALIVLENEPGTAQPEA
jgi:SAM-dependent methyltransferase